MRSVWEDRLDGSNDLYPPMRTLPGVLNVSRIAGVAHDQLRLEDELAVAVLAVLGGLLDEELGGRAAEVVAGLAHRRQRHRGGGREVDVVVADDGEVVGGAQLAAGEPLGQPPRGQGGGGE